MLLNVLASLDTGELKRPRLSGVPINAFQCGGGQAGIS